jgi:predicted GNAT superfamily acetyltransferase
MNLDAVATDEASADAEAKIAGYAIREPRDLDELSQLADVFQAVFKLSDRAAPPAWLMGDTDKAGGLTLGLWQGDQAVGVSYAIAVIDDSGYSLYSDGLGVLPQHRARGQAYAVKLAQREHALRRGCRRITWSFSALRSVNAHLYLTRLGAIGSKYVVDYRGALDSDWQTEGGVPLDEFFVEWKLDSQRVQSRLAGQAPALDLDSVPVLNSCEGTAPRLTLKEIGELPQADRLAVEVAPDYQWLVDHEPALAHEWRSRTRPLFLDLFERGYLLAECLHDPFSDRAHYVFEKASRS